MYASCVFSHGCKGVCTIHCCQCVGRCHSCHVYLDGNCSGIKGKYNKEVYNYEYKVQCECGNYILAVIFFFRFHNRNLIYICC